MIANKIELLLKAAYMYYVENDPLMSDRDYDKLFEEVRIWEGTNGIADRITDKVCLGYFEGDKTVKVGHPTPMLSVENDNNRELKRPAVITPKIDGAAVELIYKNGQLYRKLTRGDGHYGSDIIKVLIHDVPETVDIARREVVIRGEVHCPQYKKYGKSHRNVVAGAIGRVDFLQDRGLYFVPYWTNLYDEYETYLMELDWLHDNKFTEIPHKLISGNVVLYNRYMPDLPYPIDGYVLRYNDNTYYGERTNHHYKGIWAWKCVEEEEITEIVGVEWSKSKNGIWTPVAILDPIEIDDSTISRVNLMSMDYIADKNICIHDMVKVRKAKGIIPEIVEVVDWDSEKREYIYITNCPDCGAELLHDGIYLKCENPMCSIDKQIEYFCQVMGIKGLAIKSIEKLNIRSPLYLYGMSEEHLYNVLGQNGKKVYKEIQDSIKMPLVKLLTALNCPKAKEATFKKIFDKFPTIEVLDDFANLVEVEGIGNKKAEAIVDWYRNEFKLLIPLLTQIGFELIYHRETINLEIAVTGTFPMTRNEFKSIMKSKGVEVKNLTKASKLLVTGDKASQSKIDKATKYNIPVVPYHTFIKDLNNGKNN